MDVGAYGEGLIGLGLARKTIAVYVLMVDRAERWCVANELELAELRPSQVVAFVETLPKTKSSRAQARAALGAYWRLCDRQDGPERAIRVPRRPRMRCRALDDHTAAVLASLARRRGDREGLAVLLGLYAGLRRAEIASLRWRQIDGGWLTVLGKGDVERSIPLHPVLVEALGAFRRCHPAEGPHGRDWIFPGRFGGPVNPTTVWGWVRDLSRTAGLDPVATHVLRHTALAVANDNTHDLRAVQELAGHARPETTAGYTRVLGARLEQTVRAIAYGGEECA